MHQFLKKPSFLAHKKTSKAQNKKRNRVLKHTNKVCNTDKNDSCGAL